MVNGSKVCRYIHSNMGITVQKVVLLNACKLAHFSSSNVSRYLAESSAFFFVLESYILGQQLQEKVYDETLH